MVGVWEGLNLGSIPNDHMPSQKDPKISIERRCSTILPSGPLFFWQCFNEYTVGMKEYFKALGIINEYQIYCCKDLYNVSCYDKYSKLKENCTIG